jgi:hypothetical protein
MPAVEDFDSEELTAFVTAQVASPRGAEVLDPIVRNVARADGWGAARAR